MMQDLYTNSGSGSQASHRDTAPENQREQAECCVPIPCSQLWVSTTLPLPLAASLEEDGGTKEVFRGSV